MRDVLIVGGGPAGLFASLRLAEAGLRVTLFEEHGAIGEPVHCTGVLARDAFDEFDLPRHAILNELHTARFYPPAGDHVAYTTPAVEAVVIDRRVFDRALAERAEQAGVSLVCGHRVTAVDTAPDAVTVTAGNTSVRGQVAVLACGASYAVQRRMGLGMPRLLLHSAQAEVPVDRPGDVEVHFGEQVAPCGFAWAVPVVRGDRMFARIGVMCERHSGAYFEEMVRRVRARWGLRIDGCQPRKKMLPLGPIQRTYADRLLAVGDAAGLVKPTTGGGIYYSILSASVAADTLVDALGRRDVSARSLAPYEQQWRRRLGPELRWQLVLRRIAQRLTDHDIEGLFELARTDGIMPLVRRTAAFNQHREFIVALFRHAPARRLLFRAVLA